MIGVGLDGVSPSVFRCTSILSCHQGVDLYMYQNIRCVAVNRYHAMVREVVKWYRALCRFTFYSLSMDILNSF